MRFWILNEVLDEVHVLNEFLVQDFIEILILEQSQ